MPAGYAVMELTGATPAQNLHASTYHGEKLATTCDFDKTRYVGALRGEFIGTFRLEECSDFAKSHQAYVSTTLANCLYGTNLERVCRH